MTNFRDIEKLSAYLDGQLKESEAAKVETLLKTNPELASLLEELRQSQAILRRLPQRRAPRNFTLTPKMVGQKPPLPRAYPIFRFATAMATFLLVFSFATNFLAPSLSMIASNPMAYGIGGGKGGGGDSAEPEMALEVAPAAEPLEEQMAEAPAAAPVEGLATEEPGARVEPTPEMAAKTGEPDQVPDQPEPTVPGEDDSIPSPVRVIPTSWLIALGVLIFANLVILFAMRTFAAAKWKNPK